MAKHELLIPRFCPSCYQPIGQQAEGLAMVLDPVEHRKIYYHVKCPPSPDVERAFARLKELNGHRRTRYTHCPV